jgi:hypothetical protein
MMELPEGIYRATLSHPILDSLGLFPPGVQVEIVRDQVTEVELAIPSTETLLAELCQTSGVDSEAFALVGTARAFGSDDPIPRATVTIGWTRLVERTRVDLREEHAITEKRDYGFDHTITDIDGRYVSCGLPPDTNLEVTASLLEYVGDTITVQGEAGSHGVLNLAVQLPPGTLVYRTSTEGLYPTGKRQGIQGRIVDPVTGTPVPGAEVTITWTQGDYTKTETTNSLGRFRILSPWLGTFALQATALGYKSVRSDSLRIEPGSLTVVELDMPPEPIDLDPLVVVAEPRVFQLDVNGFYDRAEQGFGHFITPEKIETRQPVGMVDILRDVPGLRVEPTAFGTQVLFRKTTMNAQGGAETTCVPRLYVDGMVISQPTIAWGEEGALAGIFPDQLVSLSAIAGIEVHTRATSIPLAYGGTQGSCGVILIWTRGE